VTEFVQQGGADFPADFFVVRANRFDVFLVEEDSVRQIRLERALLGKRDAVKKPEEQVLAFGFARRQILDGDGDVRQLAAEQLRQSRERLFDQLFESLAVH